jgi:hypothetical protein
MSSLVHTQNTSHSVTHSKIASDQTYLIPKLFTVRLPKKKIYFNDMNILSILLILAPGCYIQDPDRFFKNSKDPSRF